MMMMKMKVCQFTDYRVYLQSELENRAKVNPQFSLRCYAEFLDVSASTIYRKKQQWESQIGQDQ